jgi:hypothetical protein
MHPDPSEVAAECFSLEAVREPHELCPDHRTSTRRARGLVLVRLLIVDRNRRDVYERLVDQFANDPNVRVMFDRRSEDTPPSSSERRQDEDDSRADLWDEGGYIVVVTPD